MKKSFFFAGIIIIVSACTSGRWVLIEKNYNPSEVVPRGLFLINNSDLYLGARQGLFKLDSSGSFVHIPAPVNKNIVLRSLVKCNHILFAGYEKGGLFKSADNGMTWHRTGESIFDSNKLWGLFSYDSTVIAVTWPRYIYSSSDNGMTWTDISKGMPENGMGVCGGGSQGMVLKDSFLFCSVFNEGVFRRGLHENKWRPSRSGLPGDFKTRGIYQYKNKLFVGTANGVYTSDDNGQNWTPANKDLEKKMIICFWGDNKYIYAGSNEGELFKSKNKGESWTLINEGLHTKDVIYDINGLKNNLFISVDGQSINPSGVYRHLKRNNK